MLDRSDRWMVLGLAAASCGVLLGEASGVGGVWLLHVAPLVLLAIPLVAGRYLGETRIERLARAFRPRKPRAARVSTAAIPFATPRLLPRGGGLIASSLSVRPPPAAVTPQ